MKRRRYSKSLLSALFLSAAAVAAVAWSPITCSCDAAWVAIDGAAGLNSNSPAELTPRVLADGFAKTFHGTKLELDALPHTMAGSSECGALRQGQFRCTWWLEEAPSRQRGFMAVFYAGHAGSFQKVRVSRVERVVR